MPSDAAPGQASKGEDNVKNIRLVMRMDFDGESSILSTSTSTVNSSHCSAPRAAAKELPRCASSAVSSSRRASDVLFDGVRINDVPPHKRRVNTVFQKYALSSIWTSLSLAFGLRIAKGAAEGDTARHGVLEIVSLKGL